MRHLPRSTRRPPRRPRAVRALLALALAPALQAPPGDAGPDLWAFARGLYAKDHLDVFAPAELLDAPWLVARAAELEELAGFRARLRPLAELDRGSGPRVVLATPADGPALRLLRGIGVEARDGGFVFQGALHDGRADVLLATIPDPDRPGLPLNAVLANDPAVLSWVLPSLEPAYAPGVRSLREGYLGLEGPLDASGRAAAPRDRRGARLRADAAATPVASLPAGRIVLAVPGVSRRVALHLAAAAGQAVERARAWLGVADDAPFPTLVLHAEAAELLSGTGGSARGTPSAAGGSAHALAARDVPHDGGASAAAAALLGSVGPPAEPWLLDAVATGAAGTWWGVRLEFWVGRLVRAGLELDPERLLDPTAGASVDAHVLLPQRALLVGLVAASEPGRLREAWSGTRPLATDPGLAERWHATLRRLRGLERGGRLRGGEGGPGGRRVGFVVTPPPEAGPLAGYLDPRLEESLTRLCELGARSVALVVRAHGPPPRDRRFAEPREALHASESDLGIAVAAARAKALGLDVTLIVQPLGQASGTWLDGAVIDGRAALDRVFADLDTMLVHYACLAELVGADLLCLGDELRVVTRTRQFEDREPSRMRAARAERWEALLPRLRALYSGDLTASVDRSIYVPTVGLWEDLDLVGVHAFPTWPDEEPPNDRRLELLWRNYLRNAADQAAAAGRPGIVLQAGFPSRAGSFSDFAVPVGPVDLEAQRRVYAALAVAWEEHVAEPGALAGLFLWRWSTDPDAGGADEGGFTPQGKPAEAELPRLFGAR